MLYLLILKNYKQKVNHRSKIIGKITPNQSAQNSNDDGIKKNTNKSANKNKENIRESTHKSNASKNVSKSKSKSKKKQFVTSIRIINSEDNKTYEDYFQ